MPDAPGVRELHEAVTAASIAADYLALADLARHMIEHRRLHHRPVDLATGNKLGALRDRVFYQCINLQRRVAADDFFRGIFETAVASREVRPGQSRNSVAGPKPKRDSSLRSE